MVSFRAAEELMEKISDKISVAAAELDADTIQMMRYCMLCTTHHMKLINRAQEFAYGDRKVAELLIKSFKDEMETQIPRKFWKPAYASYCHSASKSVFKGGSTHAIFLFVYFAFVV